MAGALPAWHSFHAENTTCGARPGHPKHPIARKQTMRTFDVFKGGLTVAMLTLGAAQAHAEDLTFTLNNGTGAAVVEFYLSPAEVDNWEENLLGDDALSAGASTDVTVADGRTTCVYDIKTVFKDGDVVDDRGIDLCDLGSYTIHE